MNIREKVSKNLKDAMIKKDTNLINTLRLILAAIKERDIIVKGKGHDLDKWKRNYFFTSDYDKTKKRINWVVYARQ